ncbi:MAG: sel1 repeat family protein [Gammaproteobacteria bacterium]|nr:sel1 repeat family protein [Gammaproteobacteria bacterium]
MKNIKYIHPLFLFFVQLISIPFCHAELSASLLKSAESGNTSAQYTVARSYELGKRVKSNKEQAIAWYTKAADKGHAESGYRLGLIYYKGVGGFKINLEKAFHYISMAAKARHKRSQAHLAEMYENGDGVKKSEILSDYWYEQAFTSSTVSISAYPQEKNKKSVVHAPVEVEKTFNKKPAAIKAVVSADSQVDFPDVIMNKNWFQGNNPSMYLKSTGTKCKLKNANIECISSKLKALHKTGLYKFKVKSIISRGETDKAINVIYRKLYTSVPDESVEAYAFEETTSDITAGLTVGWEKKSHSFSCLFESSRTMLCRPVGEDAFYIKSRF